MSSRIQNGIYYNKKQTPGASLCAVFLRASASSDATGIGKILSKLWNVYEDLKNGVVKDLPQNSRNRLAGNLSILIGYGPATFKIKGTRLSKPDELSDEWRFNSPWAKGGGPIMDEVGLSYASDITENPISNDHVMLQFIGNSELITQRAVVETWKLLRDNPDGKDALHMKTFYTGFKRADMRNWLGFHDGVSNMMTNERLGAIAINKSSVALADNWTINGTYLVFMRIAIDLDIWDKIGRKYQERIVGRDKITGCPLIGVDKNDNNISMKGCPIPGTFEVFEKGNEHFRTHPPYGNQINLHGISDQTLTQSHIGRAYKIDNVPSWNNKSSRIFRQGFDFLESINTSPFIRVGLNFISFQGSTKRLSGILKYGLGKANFGGNPEKPFLGENNLLSVRAAGMFLVPPYDERDAFPGQRIFWGD